MTLILDAGALIAVERSDRELVALLKAERRSGRVPVTHGGIVGQVWRDGARQARRPRLLAAVEITHSMTRSGGEREFCTRERTPPTCSTPPWSFSRPIGT